LRVVTQWVASERAGRVVVPVSYWTWSLLGTLALLVYCLHRRDPVFLAGALVNGFIYGRNWLLARTGKAPGSGGAGPILPVLLGLAVFAAVTVWAGLGERGLVRLDLPWQWLVLGGTGQALWSSRFVVQWYASERAGRSVLPASFFRISVLGALLCLGYAILRIDWVQIAAFALNPIPYVRNLVLLRRAARRGGA
jgi:lipid-A-disaccharide synthase-like uncharacterized protein